MAGYPENSIRTRALCLTKLASLTMATGDPRQAVTISHEALEIAGTIRSHRSTEKLRELFGHAVAYQDLSEVAELRHRIRTLIGTHHPSNPPRDHPPTLLPDPDSASSTHPTTSPGTTP